MRDISPESPEARRERRGGKARLADLRAHMQRGSRLREVIRRVAVGVYSDGFIHAGNLAYLALLAIFPFVIVAAAIAHLIGQGNASLAAAQALLEAMPPSVRHVLDQPMREVVEVRSGSLLWFGALVGLWTTASFIETIRDIIRRAYGVRFDRAFWEYRLGSVGIIVAAVIVTMTAFALSVTMSSVQPLIESHVPGAARIVSLLTWLQVVPALAMFVALYVLFYALTPAAYRVSGCPKWPGALFATLWWVATTTLLPIVLGRLVNYGLTYGGMAGVIVTLLFFFLVGLGLVIAAELNAALAESPSASQEGGGAADEGTAGPPSERNQQEDQ
jgi:membrane protein